MTQRYSRTGAICVFGVVCAYGFFAMESFASDKPVVHTIVMDGTAFSPDTLTVKRGDTVVWVNKDPFPHTVTAVGGAFDSKSIDAAKRWKYVAAKPGVYGYVCSFHSTMKGELKVE
jgi:plastocyanin